MTRQQLCFYPPPPPNKKCEQRQKRHHDKRCAHACTQTHSPVITHTRTHTPPNTLTISHTHVQKQVNIHKKTLCKNNVFMYENKTGSEVQTSWTETFFDINPSSKKTRNPVLKRLNRTSDLHPFNVQYSPVDTENTGTKLDAKLPLAFVKYFSFFFVFSQRRNKKVKEMNGALEKNKQKKKNSNIQR